jgi:hypothetical protein
MITLLLVIAGASATASPPDPRALAVVDGAISRMGGAELLGGIQRVRYELITQWQRLALDGRPYADRPLYEWHSDLRDYSAPAWRNTRRFGHPTKPTEITDVVRDSVATRRIGTTWSPLSVAYVDERLELFTFAPERLLLGVRRAPDLRSLPDTTIAGVPHARVAGTVGGFPTDVFLRRTDGLPAMLRYVAAQANDFGLEPFGTMEVEVWFSNWRRQPPGVNLPTQLDVRRAGAPYKRVSVVSADLEVTASPDSFAVSDSLRAAFLATQRRPMHDVPYDSTRIVDGAFAAFKAFGAPAGAVKVGGRWVLLESGQSGLSAERAIGALAALDPAPVAAAVITVPAGTNGGVVALARKRVPVHAAPGAATWLGIVLRNHGVTGGATPVTRGRWLRVGSDSLRLEPIDLPDAPGALLVYVPSLRYAFSDPAGAPLQRDYVLRRLRESGWPVERLGSSAGVATPVTP